MIEPVMNGSQINWQGHWIGRPDICMLPNAKVEPAPYFRKQFTFDGNPDNAKIHICGLGYYELSINGKKVGDHVLDPVPSQYDKRAYYVTYDLANHLIQGENVFGVILGNGWYNAHTHTVWNFHNATWRDFPKLLLQLEEDGHVRMASDPSWKVSTGPILFDGLRNGETYDARLEIPGWDTCGFDDSAWQAAVQVSPPGGEIELQTMPPCKVMQTLPAKSRWQSDDAIVFDLGQNIAGWSRITVQGKAGTQLTLTYGERLTEDKKVCQKHIAKHVSCPEHFQKDIYILKGDGKETWEPRFTYHGFQFVQIVASDDVQIQRVEGCVVHTAFNKIGSIHCDNEVVNQLQHCTEWSYIGNFVGIPTDCPHREKNGWTGDAHLATETGLFNYDAATSYELWLDTIVDTQRPNGQLPGIVPCAGWGYNWGSGPAWDCALLLIPWYIYLYTGRTNSIFKHYPAMKRYVEHCRSMANDHILSFGLGDWAHFDRSRIVEVSLTSTAYYFTLTRLLGKFAQLTKREDDVSLCEQLALQIKHAFTERFANSDGTYAKGEQTAMGAALFHGLVNVSERQKVIDQLVQSVERNDGRLDFGILGAKYIPRVLADYGHVDMAFKLITQPNMPSWGTWLKGDPTTLWSGWRCEGLTSLHENQQSQSSLNHIMFGDISAWFYQYLAGITPDEKHPGFSYVKIRPFPVQGVDRFKAKYQSAFGAIEIAWQIIERRYFIEVNLPVEGELYLPDGTKHHLAQGVRTKLACDWNPVAAQKNIT